MDGDGLPNDWELANGLSPKDSTSDHGANGDPDRDGVTNFQEFLSGTDPRDSSSLLKISSVTRGATRGIRFTAVPARTYPVQYRDTVGSGAWLKLADVPAQPIVREMEITDPGANDSARFYRLVTPQVP